MNIISKVYRSSSFFYWIYQESFLTKPLHAIKRLGIYLKFKSRMFFEYIQTIPRNIGIKDSRYDKLRSLKGKYRGKRCFITCTGPSLTIEDLEALKNEYVFGMNSICLIHEKTSWKPDFFGIQDIHVYNKVKDTLLSTDNGIVFAPYQYYTKYNTPSEWTYFHISGSYHLYEMAYRCGYFAKFSEDCYKTVYDGYSITYSIMQLAMYMGFDEIYLIGADCNYLGKQQHFIEHGNDDPAAAEAPARLFASYGRAKEYAETHNIKIINVTRGGCLELFPRMQLEDVLNKEEKNKLYQ